MSQRLRSLILLQKTLREMKERVCVWDPSPSARVKKKVGVKKAGVFFRNNKKKCRFRENFCFPAWPISESFPWNIPSCMRESKSGKIEDPYLWRWILQRYRRRQRVHILSLDWTWRLNVELPSFLLAWVGSSSTSRLRSCSSTKAHSICTFLSRAWWVFPETERCWTTALVPAVVHWKSTLSLRQTSTFAPCAPCSSSVPFWTLWNSSSTSF